MKLSVRRLKDVLSSNRGELIIETIISYTVLIILFFSVSVAIMSSFKIANSSLVRANRMQQDNINPAVMSEYAVPGTGQVTFTFNVNGETKTATHNVTYNDGTIVAFSPEV